MFNRFTERAQKVILYAQENARELKHGYVGTEHILLGLLTIEEKGSNLFLNEEGIKKDDVKKLIVQLEGEGKEEVQDKIPLTPRTKRLLDSSVTVANELKNEYIAPEHMLLALVKEGQGVAFTILIKLGADINRLFTKLVESMKAQPNVQTSESARKRNRRDNKTPVLDKHGKDLTEMALEGKLDPVIGREDETQRVLEILCRRMKNNPCLIGEPGVGKTAIAEGLAQRISEGNIPELLRDKRVITLDLSSVLAGAKYRGEFEDRLKNIMEEIMSSQNIIVFIDEIHTIVGAGGAEGAIDASNILKPALSRGEIQCIGATTLDEYRKYIEKDSALERRFQPINVGEPTKDEAYQILQGLRDKYEAHHGVKILDNALKAAVNLSDRYITDRFLPDKAIDLIDEAGSKIRLKNFTAPPDLKDLEEELEKVTKDKVDAISVQNFEKAAEFRDKEKEIKEKLDNMQNKWVTKSESKDLELTEEDVAQVVSKWTNVPVSKLTQSESDKLLNLEEILHERVIGQKEAVDAISKAIRRARVGLKDPKRPIGSFIFLGPTGVGKTELTKALAEAMFGDESNMIRIDMSEYMEKHSVSRMIGSPPGYVGFEEGGQLTEKVRRKPYSVILFDEIEKAHPEVFNILLQILEDGRVTDGKGKLVNFKNTIIIMTSNVGATTIKKQKTMGFATAANGVNTEYEKMKENMMNELKRSFRPEFLNRLDDIIVFHSLEEKDLISIVKIMLTSVKQRLKEIDITIKFDEKAEEYLAREGLDLEYGARPLRRAITKAIEDRLSEEILKNNIKKGDSVLVTIKDDKLHFQAV
ncbi:ATP-dependent Clp protease ATP-binding subunit [Oceanirhabdus sp. W0125-5]|uniref:ATP-dependent Clp protease ATP-binding subunit n=1 Tax=Oceanirhabdus sp. W0125-5 TaxID=2999116 RepID=UPI0022F2C9A4|nr:ATP-dependent Clp protease ATP-binding subunit [Oceanirhabdus sp. W0125-5]WBW97966.1 ATP-dependent Clp protease ATP-binding subunit [Oceanirhabdus sp. W0125-5]